jgi:amidase
MAPIALGTETDGSILVPSDRASLYSLKLTVGKASTHGTLPFTHLTDSLGPMTKSADDVASILDIISPIEGGTHRDALRTSFQGMRIGFLDPLEWAPGAVAVRPNEDYTQQVVGDLSCGFDSFPPSWIYTRSMKYPSQPTELRRPVPL